MNKHTPGPWESRLWRDDGAGISGWNICVNGHLLPLCDMDSAPDDDIEANARLISAAPELLEALISIAEESSDAGARACAMEAIAKATGEAQ